MRGDREQNRAFREMLRPALNRLKGRTAQDLAEKTGILYCGECHSFRLNSMGKDIRIRYPGYDMEPDLNEWHHLLILHYMDMADGTPLTGELMSFGDLPGGMVRGGGFDRRSENTLSMYPGGGDPECVKKACESIGGRIISSNADLSAVFPLFPRYPVTLKLWFADEEMPGSGKLLLDRSAGHFLSVEDAVTAGSLIMEDLIAQYRKYTDQGGEK